ncbi:hypothetical protein [Aquimarina sp. AU58]|uniref:hypothetical protein n=1 Tax=Aquimarina sp. AU58 TaxID=1874112 RepID=UPI000D6E83A3|nr:hypothetical protein [Aquimarina sp. AU58]
MNYNKVKKISLLALVFSIGFISCEQQEDISNEQNYKMKTSDLNIYDKEVDLSQSKLSVSQIVKDYVGDVQVFIEENNFKSVKYQIVFNNDKIKISNFEIVTTIADKNGEWTAMDEAFSCPGGQDLVDTCWSQDCVEDAVASQAEHFSNGETISIHHTGVLGGVKVCSNVQP